MIHSTSIVNGLNHLPYALPGSHHLNPDQRLPEKTTFKRNWTIGLNESISSHSISVNREYVNGTTVTSQSIDWEMIVNNIALWGLRLSIQNKSVIVCNHWGFL